MLGCHHYPNMKLKYQFAIQRVTDFWAAVPVGSSAREYKGVMSLNETSREIFEALRQDTTESAIVDMMYAKYGENDADRITLTQAVHDMILQLQEAGVLE